MFGHAPREPVDGCPDVARQVVDEVTLAAMFERIRAEPSSVELWLGQPFKRWSSFLWSPARDDLITLSIPVFVAHGSCDTAVPVESARRLVREFEAGGRANLRYHEYPGLDHGFRDAAGSSGLPHLELDLIQWLADTGVLDAAGVARFQSRVRAAHPELFP